MKMEFRKSRRKCFYRETLFWLGMATFIYLFYALDTISSGSIETTATYSSAAPGMFIVFGLTKLIFCSTYSFITIENDTITINGGISLLADPSFRFSEITSVSRSSPGYYLIHLNNGRIGDLTTELLSDKDREQFDHILRELFAYSDNAPPEQHTSQGIIRTKGLTCPGCGEHHFRIMQMLGAGWANPLTCPKCQSRLYKPTPISTTAIVPVLLAQQLTEGSNVIAIILIACSFIVELFFLPPRVLFSSAYKRYHWGWVLVVVFVLVALLAFLAQPFLFGRILFP